MCSLCWNQPFCFDPTRPEGQQVYGSPPCDDPRDEAKAASRLADALLARKGGFFCWKPDQDSITDWTNKGCPVDEPTRAQVEHFEACVDAPTCARPVAECGPHEDPACPEVSSTARTSACVEVPNWTRDEETANGINGAAAVVSELALQCARHGKEPPSGSQPERYCYLACVTDCVLDTALPFCNGCEGVPSNKEQSVVGTFPVEMDSTSSSVIVYFKDGNGIFQEVGSISVSGRLHFQVPAACQGPDASETCTATMTRMALASVGTLAIGGETVSNVHLINGAPVTGDFVTDEGDGSFSIPAYTQFGVTGDVSGQEHLYAGLTPTRAVITRWDWAGRVVELDVTLVSEDETLAVELQGAGIFDSLPPTSVSTVSPAVIECGAHTQLSAVNSTDPDGATDITSITWTSDPTGSDNFVWQASGVSVDVCPPEGTHRYYAKVVDSAGSSHTSFVDVTAICE